MSKTKSQKEKKIFVENPESALANSGDILANSEDTIANTSSTLPDATFEREETPFQPLDPEYVKERGAALLTYLAEGLSDQDALTLSELTLQEYTWLCNTNPRFAHLVERKKVEYKRQILLPINKAIQKGDEKLAQWMAETKYRDEYSKRHSHKPQENPVAVIINQIQTGQLGAGILPAAAQEVARDEISKPIRIIDTE